VTRRQAFMLVVSVVCVAEPQIAHASCVGSACDSLVRERQNRDLEKREKAAVKGKDLGEGGTKGCVGEKCGGTSIPKGSPSAKAQVNTPPQMNAARLQAHVHAPTQMNPPPLTRAAVLDAHIAKPLPQRGTLPAPQPCSQQPIGNGPPADRINGVRRCLLPTAPSSSLAASSTGAASFKIAGASLEPAAWGDLDGWMNDNHADAFATFQASCRPIVRTKHSDDIRPVRAALRDVCARAIGAGALDTEKARRFFETNFRPVRVHKLGEAAGFLTGYYEPIVDGSRFPTREFKVPIYRRPPDLLAAGATHPGGPFPNRGPAFRKTLSGEIVPYYDRAEIEDGALDGQQLEICWVRSTTEALAIQIEGSARIRLEDGTMLRINYDAHNGYPFVPVSRLLIDRNVIPRQQMSMRRLSEWIEANPDRAREIQRENRSLVFFRIVGLTNDREALGAQGIPLSAGRSIAVDSAVHVYGTPFFIEANLPLGGEPYRRTMIAQDTGSAITGPARADIYFGAGEEAGKMAGRVQQPGRFTMLLPGELTLEAANVNVPLPRARPATAPPVHPPPPLTIAGGEKLRSKFVLRAPSSGRRLGAVY
jgi:peptidoglycan lytic transglycosylase A